MNFLEQIEKCNTIIEQRPDDHFNQREVLIILHQMSTPCNVLRIGTVWEHICRGETSEVIRHCLVQTESGRKQQVPFTSLCRRERSHLPQIVEEWCSLESLVSNCSSQLIIHMLHRLLGREQEAITMLSQHSELLLGLLSSLKVVLICASPSMKKRKHCISDKYTMDR